MKVILNNNTFRRWSSFAVACLGCCFVGGSIYLFATYAIQLKDRLKFNQKEINVVGACMFLGGCILLYPLTWLSDILGQFFGTLLCTTVGTFGYLMMYLTTRGILHVKVYAVLFFMSCVGFHVIGLFTLSLPIVMSHFSTRVHKDIASSSMQALYGLGNVCWPLIYRYALKLNLEHGFLLLTIVTAIGGLSCVLFIRKPYTPDTDDVTVIVESTSTLQFLWRLATNISFWIILFAFCINFGTTVDFMANIGSMEHSLGGKPEQIFLIVVIYGACQTGGRLICCVWSSFGLSPFPLAILSLVIQMVVYFTAYGYQSILAVEIYLWFTGVSYGLCFTTLFTTLGNMYSSTVDEKHLGKLFSLATFAGCGLGPIIFNLISGSIYDNHGFRTPDGSYECLGKQCYRNTFLISAVCDTVAASLLTLVALIKWRLPQVYTKINPPRTEDAYQAVN